MRRNQNKSATTIEKVLSRLIVTPSKEDIYPEGGKRISEERPHPLRTKWAKFKSLFARNSSLVIASHLIKSIFGPTILAMPNAFKQGGLTFASFGFIALIALISYNMRRLVISADYLTKREEIEVKTYDEVAFVSFLTCSDRTKNLASTLKLIINIMFILTRLDACIIFMIFVARNVDALLEYYFPGNGFSVRIILFLQGFMLLWMNSIRTLTFLTPFSLAATIVLWIALIFCLNVYLIQDLPSPAVRSQIGDLVSINRFISIVLFSQSGISISLTLKSSMGHPEQFLGIPGVLSVSMSFICITYIIFGFTGYLQYGEETHASIMLNLPLDEPFSIGIKVMAIVSIFCSIPIVFYITFNVLWNNFIKKHIQNMNPLFPEFFVRYCMIVFSFIWAVAFPELGPMIILKGALLHSYLEIIFPPLLDYVTFYPEKGTGLYHCRLLKTIGIMALGFIFFVGGTAVGISDLITESQDDF